MNGKISSNASELVAFVSSNTLMLFHGRGVAFCFTVPDVVVVGDAAGQSVSCSFSRGVRSFVIVIAKVGSGYHEEGWTV